MIFNYSPKTLSQNYSDLTSIQKFSLNIKKHIDKNIFLIYYSGANSLFDIYEFIYKEIERRFCIDGI